MDLDRREAGAVGVVHRLDHVVDELLSNGCLDFGAIEGTCFGAQHRMAHARNLEDRHGGTIIPGLHRR